MTVASRPCPLSCPHCLALLVFPLATEKPSCSDAEELRRARAPPQPRHCLSQHASSSGLLRATISTHSQCRSSLGEGLLATSAAARHDRGSPDFELPVAGYHRSSLTPFSSFPRLPREP